MTKITIIDTPELSAEDAEQMEAAAKPMTDEDRAKIRGHIPKEIIIPRHFVDRMKAEGIDIEEVVAMILKDMGSLQ